MPETRPAPYHLVNDEGDVTTGIFRSACPSSNLERAALRLGPATVPRWVARLRFKSWQHFACVLPDLFMGVAVVDLGWMRTSWCCVRHRGGASCIEHTRRGPLLDLRVASDLWEDQTWAHARDYVIDIENAAKRHQHRIWTDIAGRGPHPAVRASLVGTQDLGSNHPLVVCMPIGRDRFMYSHKAVLPLEGEITVGGQRWQAEPRDCFAILDVHKAYYPHHTAWQWGTLAGRLDDGRWIGLNLTRNGNRDDATVNENALWLDGAIEHLGPARFARPSAEPMGRWRLESVDGRVALEFTPEAKRCERLRLGLVRSCFDQIQGTFRGSVRFGGETIAVDDLFGLCEDHDSLW